MKRILAVVLTALIVLPVVLTGGVVFMPDKENGSAFSLYADAIEAALGSIDKIEKSDETAVNNTENRFLVKFSKDADKQSILQSLKDTVFVQLDNDGLLYQVCGDGFLNNQQIIEYYEKDLTRSALATVNDPVSINGYETMGIYGAWDKTMGKSDVIVAVLDTGVYREHEDLKNANILAGYDAVARKAGVFDDEEGHGTGVIGLIAATADNGLGIAGVSGGVTVLPIKVAATGKIIYSSDLVRGIRFAADAGAKIINMSIGGYSSSVAEQEAINYAVSKGCIIIAAAGNGGTSEYAHQKSYPASYDGVISVASCTLDGEKSLFSQSNDMVDVAAPGENIPMLSINQQGSNYRTDSGTSYSCAFVSGIAALTISVMDNVRFETDEFLSLINEVCGTERTDDLGFGVINAESIVAIANHPIITGVINGKTYSETVKIGFNRGTATLDGEVIEDGETVIANGSHTLIVKDENVTKTVKFYLDYAPLTYKFKELPSYCYFEFDRGSALLDGFPYQSGDKITTSGNHEFVLIDKDEKVSKTFRLKYSLPSVFGIEDDGKYNHPVEIRIIGEGNAYLDGVEIFGGAVVCENGIHNLTVKSGNGELTKEYFFTVNFNKAQVFKTDYSNGTAAVDETNGFACIYGDSLVGVRIYDLNDLEKYLHFLPVGRIYNHVFQDDELWLFGDEGITVLNRGDALLGKDAIIKTVKTNGLNGFVYAEENIFCFGNGNMYSFDLDTGTTNLVTPLGFDCKESYYNDDKFYLIPEDENFIYIFDITTFSVTRYDLGFNPYGSHICCGEGYISVGNKLYDGDSGKLVLEVPALKIIKIEKGLLYTETRIVEISTGKELASLPFAASDIVSGPENNYIFGMTTRCAIINKSAEGYAAYGAAARQDKMFSAHTQSNPYRISAFYDEYSHLISISTATTTLYAVFKNSFALYRMDTSTGNELSNVPLLYQPSDISVSNAYVTVCFENAPMIYITPAARLNEGKYIDFGEVCDTAIVINNRIFAIANGKILTCSISGGNVSQTHLNAVALATDDNYIYIYDGNKITAYDGQLNQLALNVQANGDELFVGNGVAIKRKIFNKTGSELIAELDSPVLAFRGNTVITKKGVFDLNLKQYVGTTGIEYAQYASITKNNDVVTLGNGYMTINSCLGNEEIITTPNVTGIEEYSVHLKEVKITYDHGIGFVDGKEIKTGSTVSQVGSHIFLLSLPCGRNLLIPFTIEAELSGIKFLIDKRTMSVGEKIALRVKYLPDGASSIPVNFTCDKEGLEISSSGEVTALKVGKYVVTATTSRGDFEAKTEITVRDDLIAFSAESGLVIDRNTAQIIGIKAGTSISQFLSFIPIDKKIEISNNDKTVENGVIGTGFKVLLYNEENEITDELTAVVRGDTDKDGFISANDLVFIERILKGETFPLEIVTAADVDGNTVVTDNDFRGLKRILFGRSNIDTGITTANPFGNCTVQTVSKPVANDIIDVAVCISGCKYARGVFGEIEFSQGLEFLESESLGWVVDSHLNGNKIGFFAYSEKDEECGPFRVLINLRFKVTAQHGTKIGFYADKFYVTFKSDCKTIEFTNREITVLPRVYDKFNVDFSNADSFNFDINKKEYTATIPHDNALADISVTYGANESVEISSLVINDLGFKKILISHISENGTSEIYTITVKRATAPKIDSNCKLQIFEVEGYRISPAFNPNFYNYSITVPYGTEKVNLYCVAENSDAKVIIGNTLLNGETTVIPVTVITQDGESLVYNLAVNMLPYQEPVQSTPDEESNENGFAFIIWIVILALVGVFAAISTVKYLQAKNKNSAE